MGLSAGDLVTLNVGGVLFTTTAATLTARAECKLALLCRDGTNSTVIDKNGHPFIDR